MGESLAADPSAGPGLPPTPDPGAILDRHAARRASGGPTVSVLVGPPGLGLAEAARWAEGSGRGSLILAGDEVEAAGVASAWADAFAAGADLAGFALGRVALRSGRDPIALRSRMGRASRLEVDSWLDGVVPHPGDDPQLDAAAAWIVRHAAAGAPLSPGLAPRLGRSLDAQADPDRSARLALATLGGLVPPGSGPALILASRGDSPGFVERAADVLGALAMAQPRLTAILVVDPESHRAYLDAAPESHPKALARSGTIGLDPGAVGRSLVAGASPEAARSALRLASDGASPGLAQRFLDADRLDAEVPPPSRADDAAGDRARSAAERFLAERLASLPATTGLFELNGRLDLAAGPGWPVLEVDLLARSLRIAVEVDGYYHFRDEAAYRRDRRKDLALQRGDYLVVRCLATDVVRRLEDVLGAILSAVASRRDRPGFPPPSPPREPRP